MEKILRYSVALDVLENYYNDRGVLYFKIVMNEDKKEIFYSILYPSKIKSYLDEARRKKNKKQINIVLTKLQPKSSEMLRICRQFTLESNRQGSGRGQIVPKTVCINDIGKYKSLQATAVDTQSPIEFARRLSTGDACFYVQGDSDIWLPVSTKDGAEYFVRQRVVRDISVGGRVFYSEYEIIYGTDDSFSIKVSSNLILHWSRGKVDFKEMGDWKELYNDALFLRTMINSTQIEVAGVPLTYNNCKIPEGMMNEWDFIIDLYQICKMANMKIQTPIRNFSVYDRKYAERLVDILYGRIATIEDTLYTYDYADLRYQVENTDYNLDTIGTLHRAVIALISAYDISNENELLEIAEMMLNKIYAVDSTIVYAHINEWQIKKRKNTLSNDDIKEMGNLLKNNGADTQINCAIYALLDDRESAQKYFEKMSEKEQTDFREFPIYKYVE